MLGGFCGFVIVQAIDEWIERRTNRTYMDDWWTIREVRLT